MRQLLSERSTALKLVAPTSPLSASTSSTRFGFAIGSYDGGYAVTGSPSFDNNTDYLTDAGAYASSASAWGTFDQLGNVWEWTESEYSSGPQLRYIIGNAYNTGAGSFTMGSPSSLKDREMGFRIAFVPEPSSLTLMVASLFAFGFLRKRDLLC
jgi:formylglycine-generating enzyme